MPPPALDEVSSWPVDRAAAGYVTVGGGQATIGPLDLALPLASITKVLTALAVLVAAEEGTVELDEPAGGIDGVTLRHLLAHTSGLPFEGDAPVGAPGRRRIYSNTGIERAAAHLADRSAIPFEHYLDEAVLTPLAMASTSLGGRSPAAGAVGSAGDLLRLAAELLAPTLVSSDTLAAATSVQFPGLAGVLPGFGRMDPCDWGLGFELRGTKAPHWTGTGNDPSTFGHFGGSGTFLWVDPVAGVACTAVTDRPFGTWAAERWPTLADAVLREAVGRPPQVPRADDRTTHVQEPTR